MPVRHQMNLLMISRTSLLFGLLLLLGPVAARGAIQTTVERLRNDEAKPSFKFPQVPAPSRNDAAAQARFVLVDGARDRNGGSLDKLHDGRVPKEDDQPTENFFLNAGGGRGRLLVDLQRLVEVKQVNTYSWHGGGRGPQVYRLFVSAGDAGDFNEQPKLGTDPTSCGWTQLADVDTRPKNETSAMGGQYGVSLFNRDSLIGSYRYLLFDISKTAEDDPFGHTFYSEIDVVDAQGPAAEPAVAPASAPEDRPTVAKTFEAGEGKYRITIDTTVVPDLTEWTEKNLAPVTQAWYPKIVAMLPSDNFQAPEHVTIVFRENMRVPAAASGNRISCNADWFKKNLDGEARGSVVHELVHVVQQYGRARRDNPNATRAPGWLVEGIPDYIRWFLYEPETKGAEITRRNLERAKYDASYRITGNFLNWVVNTFDKEIIRKLNTAAREGKYREDLWKEYTGKTVQELGEQWKKGHEDRLAAAGAQ